MPATFINGSLPAKDFETIVVSTAAVGLTASKLTATDLQQAKSGDQSYIDVKRMDEVFITVETDTVRFRMDGTAPTSSVGHQLSDGDSIYLSGFGNLSRLKFIRSGGSDATIQVTYFRKG